MVLFNLYTKMLALVETLKWAGSFSPDVFSQRKWSGNSSHCMSGHSSPTIVSIGKYSLATPQKFNIAPAKLWLEDDPFLLGNCLFFVAMLNCPGSKRVFCYPFFEKSPCPKLVNHCLKCSGWTGNSLHGNLLKWNFSLQTSHVSQVSKDVVPTQDLNFSSRIHVSSQTLKKLKMLENPHIIMAI